MSLVIEYREYTTTGRFVSGARFLSVPEVATEDLELLFESNDEPTRVAIGKIYKQQRLMETTEELKPLFKTNVVVRDAETGRFVKWSSF